MRRAGNGRRTCGCLLAAALTVLVVGCTSGEDKYLEATADLPVPEEPRLQVGEGLCHSLWEAENNRDLPLEAFNREYVLLIEHDAKRQTAHGFMEGAFTHLCSEYKEPYEEWAPAGEWLHDCVSSRWDGDRHCPIRWE